MRAAAGVGLACVPAEVGVAVQTRGPQNLWSAMTESRRFSVSGVFSGPLARPAHLGRGSPAGAGRPSQRQLCVRDAARGPAPADGADGGTAQEGRAQLSVFCGLQQLLDLESRFQSPETETNETHPPDAAPTRWAPTSSFVVVLPEASRQERRSSTQFFTTTHGLLIASLSGPLPHVLGSPLGPGRVDQTVLQPLRSGSKSSPVARNRAPPLRLGLISEHELAPISTKRPRIRQSSCRHCANVNNARHSSDPTASNCVAASERELSAFKSNPEEVSDGSTG